MHAHEDYLTILSWSIYSELQYESRCTLLLDLESIECYALFRFSMLHGNWLFFLWEDRRSAVSIAYLV